MPNNIHNLKQMSDKHNFEDRIFTIRDDKDFNRLALEVFRFQYRHNRIYKKFVDVLGRSIDKIASITDIPFIPVELFKSQKVVSFDDSEEIVFTSSGTTGSNASKHFVKDVSLYYRSFMGCFKHFYGDPAEFCVLALLPDYLERTGSSLVYMAAKLIDASGHPDSGFYLNDLDRLHGTLQKLIRSTQKVLLLGVSFALLELAERFPVKLKNTVMMETGGMKGRRREMIRAELHHILCKAFHQEAIHSEYGMTELLSQAYSKGQGLFRCPPWMRVLIRDGSDPLNYVSSGRSGGINIIDLANIHSCSFIATQDVGKIHPDGMFEVLGRFDHSDTRGCNLLMET